MTSSPISTEAKRRSRARFVTAQNNPRTPTQEDRDDVDYITEQVIALGASIEQLVPNGRNKSLALTALEDVLTRANKGIYTEKPEIAVGDPHYEPPQPPRSA